MKKIYSLVCTILVLLSVQSFAQTINWNFGTAAPGSASPSSGLPIANLSVSDVSQGNNNGTTTLLTTTSASSGYTGASGSYNAGAAARVGALNTAANGSAYFEFTLTPSNGATVTITGINFGTRSTGTGPQAYSIRSNADNFVADLATGTIANNSTWSLKTNTLNANATSAITIRIYGYAGTGTPSAGTANWRIDDLSVQVTVSGGNAGASISVAAGTAPSEPLTDGNFTITISAAQLTATTINYTVSGTATSGTDYTALSGTVEIPAGQTSAPVVIDVIDDTDYDPGETVILTLGTPPPGFSNLTSSATLTIGDNDALPATKISTIQGSGNTATTGSATVEGIVTGVYPNLNPAGFYMQEEDVDADGNSSTSEGIFVVSGAAVAVGDKVNVTGTVQEDGIGPSFGQAVITSPTVSILSNNNPLPTAVDVSLPVTATSDFEKYEGMLIRFPATLTVSNNENLSRFGEVKLSANGLVYQPTQLIDPNDNPASGTTTTGASNVAAINALIAQNNLRTILLDDGRTSTVSLPYVNSDNTLRIGSTITNLTGILGFGFSQYRMQPVTFAAPSFTYALRPAVPVFPSGNIKIASFNVLNYFNGNGAGGDFPTSRGASSPAEFVRQRNKILNALVQLNADVVGLVEIENGDANDATSALADLVNGLNGLMGAGTYAFIDDDLNNDGRQDNNTDQIRTAIIYKPAVVEAVNAAMLANDPVFDRPALAQTFRLIASNVRFNFVVNHFKSKGGAGTGADADQNDGQDAFNDRRKRQAAALLTFFNSVVRPTSGSNFIVSVGDYNAYFEEDPMDVLRAGGYRVLDNAESYSYLFEGQVGALDHAVVSGNLVSSVVGVAKWNSNAAEPEHLNYEDAVNDVTGDAVNPFAFTYTVSPWRASDHDAVVLQLNLLPENAPLPVQLVGFNAKRQDATVALRWETSQEIDTKEFIVEKSTDGANFSPLTTVPARGNNTAGARYSAVDAQPAAGINYYRLRIVDFTGYTEYSRTAKINFAKAFTVSLLPNPASGRVMVSLSNTNGDYQLQLVDMAGRVVKTQRLVQALTPVALTGVSKGMYLVRITSGPETYTERLIIE